MSLADARRKVNGERTYQVRLAKLVFQSGDGPVVTCERNLTVNFLRNNVFLKAMKPAIFADFQLF